MILEVVRDLAEWERAAQEAIATEEQPKAAEFGEESTAFAHVVEHETTDGHRLGGFAARYPDISTWLGVHGLYFEDHYARRFYRSLGEVPMDEWTAPRHGGVPRQADAGSSVSRLFGTWREPAKGPQGSQPPQWTLTVAPITFPAR